MQVDFPAGSHYRKEGLATGNHLHQVNFPKGSHSKQAGLLQAG